MIIGGLQKFSLLDYPGKISAIIFTQGCNFRCHFCYNPMLVGPKKSDKVKIKESKTERNEKDQTQAGSSQDDKSFESVKEADLFCFLKNRVGKLDAIVITGGEPTLHNDLPDFIKKIKELGYLIKLDTNGTNPEMLKALVKNRLIDYLAMDIKAPIDKYESVVGVKLDFENIKKSVKIIIDSGLGYEFRTTMVPELTYQKDVADMGEIIKGANQWFLQVFKSDIDLVNDAYKGKKSYSVQEMQDLREMALQYVKKCEIR
jgi:pyruvate formate lyase activating enzyme